MIRLLRLLLENLHWKLFSLALAVLLWFTFVAAPELATSVSVPIEYQNIPTNLEIVASGPERVHLEIQGSAARLENVSGAAVVLDLGSIHEPGERTFTISQSNVRLPFGLKLIRAMPSQIRVEFERRITREVPVQVRLSSPPPGYRVRSQEVQPARLAIAGPESRVKEVEYAETDRIDLSQMVSQGEFRVHAFVRDPQVRFATSPLVRVRVALEKSG